MGTDKTSVEEWDDHSLLPYTAINNGSKQERYNSVSLRVKVQSVPRGTNLRNLASLP